MKVLSKTMFHQVAGAAGIFALIALMAQGASAATCTSSAVIGPKTITASLDGAISSSVGNSATDGCTAMAGGNLDHSGTITAFGYTYAWVPIQKDVEADDGSAGALTISDTSGDSGDSKSGTWRIDLTRTGPYNNFIVGLKVANAFAYFNVGDETSGTYGDADDLSHGLSHANLYGRISPVPLPAAVWLFGSALFGLGVAKRRKA